jgi:hypothetical protein
MAGYAYDYSMSNNAISAYEDGERPLSKWTKTAILEGITKAIKDDGLTLACSMNVLKKASVATLRDLYLWRSSWHHTSSHYNRTDFYSIDTSAIEDVTDDILVARKAAEQVAKAEKKAEPVKEERYLCEYLVWSGTRKHPKATACQDVGVIRGNWFFLPDGSKKSITANGFRKIEKVK